MPRTISVDSSIRRSFESCSRVAAGDEGTPSTALKKRLKKSTRKRGCLNGRGDMIILLNWEARLLPKYYIDSKAFARFSQEPGVAVGHRLTQRDATELAEIRVMVGGLCGS